MNEPLVNNQDGSHSDGAGQGIDVASLGNPLLLLSSCVLFGDSFCLFEDCARNPEDQQYCIGIGANERAYQLVYFIPNG